MTIEGGPRKKDYPEAPGWILVNTGEEGEIEEKRIAFFEAILDYLDYPQEGREYFYRQIDYWAFPTEWMTDDVTVNANSLSNGRSTDDSMSVLTLGPDHIIAFEIRTRTAFNRVQAVIGHCLNPQIEEHVRFKPRED